MQNFHLLYAHRETYTLRVEGLTSEHYIQEALRVGREVRVFDAQSDVVREVPFGDLVSKTVPFMRRGWPVAELHWSLGKPAMQNLAIPFHHGSMQYAPMAPDEFISTLPKKLTYTHRADADVVPILQEQVFCETVARSRELSLTRLPAAEVGVLSRALPHFRRLEVLDLDQSQLAGEEAQATHHGDSRGVGTNLSSAHDTMLAGNVCM